MAVLVAVCNGVCGLRGVTRGRTVTPYLVWTKTTEPALPRRAESKTLVYACAMCVFLRVTEVTRSEERPAGRRRTSCRTVLSARCMSCRTPEVRDSRFWCPRGHFRERVTSVTRCVAFLWLYSRQARASTLGYAGNEYAPNRGRTTGKPGRWVGVYGSRPVLARRTPRANPVLTRYYKRIQGVLDA